MAEALAGLAIAASVVAVIQIADRVVGVCKYYLGHVKDAPADLRAVLVEISSVKSLFENLQFLSKCKQGYSKAVSSLDGPDGPVERCRVAVKALEDLFPSDLIQQTNSNRWRRKKVKATLAALAWPLREKKAKTLLAEIGRYKSAISLALVTDSAHDIKTILSNTLEIRNELSEVQRNEVYRWLKHTDPSQLHHQACGQYEPGTGNWVLRSPEWAAWLALERRCVWIHGIPGAGKTVLMSYLIKQVTAQFRGATNPKLGIVYYYCYFGHNQDEAIPLLRWLLEQLCRQVDAVPFTIRGLMKRGGEPSQHDLLEGIHQVLDSFETAYLAVDAVDESQCRKNLLAVLTILGIEERFKKLRLLVSSREYREIEVVMTSFSTPVSMSNPFVEEDIGRLVKSLLYTNRKYRNWPQTFLTEIEHTISTQARGM
ncbi:hypothetical protein BDV96DRAFT_581488 [Lophiotrema nucula]|uniref:Nephrocystin 3-like N-terminal domain-containing protein n=1 Tax=Lophiotrema nucula TaxID=690887 RepID=A0A6A5YZY7_9PLEO|nr:hypothetical protein BDV96DRAFT_581488 [Lophiotrema nucula]